MTDFSSILEPLGLAVLHSLWQGALALVLVLGLRRLAGPSRPHLACLAGTVGLLATFGAFLVTLTLAIGSNPAPATLIPGGLGVGEPLALLEGGGLVAAGAAEAGAFAWRAALPWLGAVWAVGFFLLSLQCMYAWAKTRCYTTIGLSVPEGDWTARFARLVERSGVRTDIRLRVSALVESPVTLGTLKPLVLVPGGFLTGFPPEQVEAILLHEIAHIRRHDFIFGLIQTAIRTTLYFNPAVRIMSRLVDEDREQACDDFAVAQSGRPLDLAKGLAALRLSLAPSPVMAANGSRSGPLMARLQRITGQRAEVRGLDRLTAAGLGLIMVGAVAFAPNSFAHPHWWDRSDKNMDEEVVVPEAPEAPKMPEIPNIPTFAVPAMPAIPGMPEIPAMPAMPFQTPGAYAGLDFEGAMEAWGEDMEDWGHQLEHALEGEWAPELEARMEAWAENFEANIEPQIEAWAENFEANVEPQIEAWAEKMEAWGESIEADGEHIEYFDDMSDEELAEIGLSRSDVELAAEDFGLSVAEGVVGSMLAGGLEDKARAEIAAERAALDQKRLATVKNKMAAEMTRRHVQDRTTEARDRARATRDEAYAKRDKAYADRDARRAERDRLRAERDAERAERDAERALRRAEREADRRAHKEMEENAFEAGDVSRALLRKLRADGLIDADTDRYTFKSSKSWTKVDGKRISDDKHDAYRAYLVAENMPSSANIGIEKKRDRLELEMRDGSNVTRITMTD